MNIRKRSQKKTTLNAHKHKGENHGNENENKCTRHENNQQILNVKTQANKLTYN